RSERFEANRRRRLLGRDRAKRDAPSVCLTGWMPLFSKIKVLLDFFQKIAVSKGRAFGRSSQ
ncbi:hypothetical protein, partial [Anaerotruncus sp. G3(2012)]|uniref:hypothetical protein n=1 Tax=Anaerotruncus sp. G3(2012) TaxID=1235835 RepID=UPI001A99EB76